jgi:hypothetical protein
VWAGSGEVSGLDGILAAGGLDSTGGRQWEDPPNLTDAQYVGARTASDGSVRMVGWNASSVAATGVVMAPAGAAFVVSRTTAGVVNWITPFASVNLWWLATGPGGVSFAAGQPTQASGIICGYDGLGGCPDGAIIAALDPTGKVLWQSTYASSTGFTSLAAWADGGVSGALKYSSGFQGPGLTRTGSGTTLVKWNADSSIAWSVDAPAGVVVGPSALTSDGRLVFAVHTDSPGTAWGPVTLDTNNLVFFDATGQPTSSTSWPNFIEVLTAGSTGDLVVAGSQLADAIPNPFGVGCDAGNEASCPGRYVSYLRVASAAPAWTVSFTVMPGSSSIDPIITDAVAGNDGAVYVAVHGILAAISNSSGWPIHYVGATAGYANIFAVRM